MLHDIPPPVKPHELEEVSVFYEVQKKLKDSRQSGISNLISKPADNTIPLDTPERYLWLHNEYDTPQTQFISTTLHETKISKFFIDSSHPNSFLGKDTKDESKFWGSLS